MKVNLISVALAKGDSLQLPRFYVIGDVDFVLKELALKGSKLLKVPPGEKIVTELVNQPLRLDPGGGAMLDAESVQFTLQNVKFTADAYKLRWIHENLDGAEESPPGYWRLPCSNGAMNWFIFIPTALREELLCQLMSYEFAPGVKEDREKAQAKLLRLFNNGITTRLG